MDVSKLKLISCNVNGIGQAQKRRKFFTYLRDQSIDIALIQETYAGSNSHKIWKNEWGGRILMANYSTNARGVAIMFKRDLEIEIKQVKKDVEGRYIVVSLDYNGQSMLLINVYAPNNECVSFYENIFEMANSSQADYSFIGGDFNKALDHEIDRKTQSKEKSNSVTSDYINEFLENSEWIDIWRVKHQDSQQFTWMRRRPICFSRLDYFLMPMHQIGRVLDCEILAHNLSDHSFVTLTFEIEKVYRGKGLWKFNNSLLYDHKYIEQMNAHIDVTQQETSHQTDDSLRWEIIKNSIIEYTKWYAKKGANETQKEYQKLAKRLNALQKKLHCINLNASNVISIIQETNDRIDHVKREMSRIENKRCKGAMLRAKINWTQEAGQSSKYFLNLEKSRSKNKTMSAVQLSDGSVSRNSQTILDQQRDFYKKLYTKDDSVEF